MAYVNAEIPEPEPPGPWIEAEFDDDDRLVEIRCICGAHLGTYTAFNSGVTFGEAADYVREMNQLAEVDESQGELEFRPHLTGGDWHNEAPGGFRSRGSVLWAMRVLKMQRFYAEHETCPDDDFDWDEFCTNWPDSATCHGFEEWLAYGKPESSQELQERRQAAGFSPRAGTFDYAEEEDEEWVPF